MPKLRKSGVNKFNINLNTEKNITLRKKGKFIVY